MELSPIEWVVILTSLTSGTLGALGIGSYFYFRARANLQAHRRRQEQHLARLQRLTSKLLNACDALLGGESPEETILYQRFKAHGGEYYEDVRLEVYEALRRSQPALNAAFELHQKLIDPAVQQNRSLEQQIGDWELLYATLVGQSERIQAMTGPELRTLLNPMLAAEEEEATFVDLVRQLEELKRELAEKPLKIKWQRLVPELVEAEGILDYIDRVKTHLAYLPERHKQEAPYWLAEAKFQRQAAETATPSYLAELYRYIMARAEGQSWADTAQASESLELNVSHLFADVERQVAYAEAAQTMGRFFQVIEQAYAIWLDMETLKTFLKAMKEHGRRQAKIDTLTSQGYCPPNLTDDLQEIKADAQTITHRILAGNYSSAAPWIEELNTDSQRALAEIEAWQALHEENRANLHYLQERLAGIVEWWQTEGQPAWEKLQSYASPNWSDLAAKMNQAQQTFDRVQSEQVDQLESLNSLEVQKLKEAEQLLAYTMADLDHVEQRFLAMRNRLAELQTAQERLPEALRLAEADLARAKSLRDDQDPKISPEVDRQIEQAQDHLAEANRLQEEGRFLKAIEEQTAARRLATAAYVAADEQVREINGLQTRLDSVARSVQKKLTQCLAEADQLSAVVETRATHQLAQQLQAEETAAEQSRLATSDLEDRALAQALQAAIAAYESLGQRTDWVAQQIATDQAEYDQALTQTLAAIAEAQAAIREAKLAVSEVDASGAGQRALHRAELALPTADETKQATRERLHRVHQQAQEVIRYARQGEKLARRKLRLSPASLPEPDKEVRPRLRRLGEKKKTTTSQNS